MDDTFETKAFELMRQAFEMLKKAEKSRENSLVITKLEEAMMWCNKDRTIKGQLKPTPTHFNISKIIGQINKT